jgi:hypothetical protein
MRIVPEKLQEELAKTAVMQWMTIKELLLNKAKMPTSTYYTILSKERITWPQLKKLWKYVDVNSILENVKKS